MKMKKWKRVFSGILAAVTVLSTCIPGSVMASSEEVEVCFSRLKKSLISWTRTRLFDRAIIPSLLGATLTSAWTFPVPTDKA